MHLQDELIISGLPYRQAVNGAAAPPLELVTVSNVFSPTKEVKVSSRTSRMSFVVALLLCSFFFPTLPAGTWIVLLVANEYWLVTPLPGSLPRADCGLRFADCGLEGAGYFRVSRPLLPHSSAQVHFFFPAREASLHALCDLAHASFLPAICSVAVPRQSQHPAIIFELPPPGPDNGAA